MSVFVLFFVELMVMRFARFGHSHDHDVEHQPMYVGSHPPSSYHDSTLTVGSTPDSSSIGYQDEPLPGKGATDISHKPSEIPLQDSPVLDERRPSVCAGPHVPGDDHLSHARTHPSTGHGKPSTSTLNQSNTNLTEHPRSRQRPLPLTLTRQHQISHI